MKLLRYSFILLLAFVSHLASIAQEPVTVTVAPLQYVLPPHLGNYLEEPGDYFTLVLRNNTEQPQYVYMGMQIDQIMPAGDLHVITPPARMPQMPIAIGAGETKALSKIEMKTMFNHLAMSDISVTGEVKNGLLPEGTYEACLTAYKYDPTLTSPYPLSNPTNGRCTFQICYLSDAPQFMTPIVDVNEQFGKSGSTRLGTTPTANTLTGSIDRSTKLPTATTATTTIQRGDAFGGKALVNTIDYGNDLASLTVASLPKEMPLFTWTNPYNNCGLIGSNVTYTLTIKEMMPGQSPYEAMDYGAVIHEETGIIGLQCLLPQNALKRMYENLVYVAQLKAVSSTKEGAMNFMAFKNEGKSEIRLFRLTSQAPDLPTDEEEKGGEDENDSDLMVWMGNVSAKDSVNHDSLYTFRTPHLIEPFFLSTEGARKVFMDGDILSKWDRVHFLGGEGLENDTIQFAYDLQLYDGGSNSNMEEVLKQQPIYTHRTTDLKDSIPWEAIMDKVSAADYMVLRVKPVALYAKSVAFTEDGPNMIDFAMMRRLSRTLLNCSDHVDISNTTPTTKTANELKNTTVAIGQYQLTLDGNLTGSGSTGFTGDGHVEWNPLGLKVMVAVKFEKLKINNENVVYEGIAKTYPGNDLPGIMSVQEIFSDWGVDNLMADAEIPFSDQLQSLTTDKVSSLAEKYNINTYYTYIKTYGKSLSTGDLGNLHLPIKVEDIYNGSPIDIQLEEMQFRPTFATMNIIGEFELPESDALENKTLLLGAPYLCITPDRFLPETGNLCLLGDFKLKDPESGFDIKFVAPNDLQNPVEGCYVSWKDDAFLALQLHAEMSIPDLKKDVNGEAIDEKPILTVKTTIDDWSKWRAMASMDAFQVEDLPGYTFHPGEVVIDHHKGENDPDMSLPKGYDKAVGGISNEAEWQGIYMRNLWVSLPDFIESGSKDSEVTNTENTTGASEETKVKVENKRIKFELSHLYIDLFNDACDGRFTCKASLNTSEVLTASTNSLGGWGISLDEIYVDMLQSHLVEAGFRGKFSIPLLKDKQGERAKINYKAYIPSADKATKRLYCFETTQEVDVMMDFFLAEATFDKKQTYFYVEKPEGEDTRVELCLGGDITVSSRIAETTTVKTATSIGFKLPGIKFSHMRLANCPRWKSEGSEVQAAAYEAWLKEVGQNTKTEMDDGESVYFDVGKWSCASPQKKVGGMDFNFDYPSINLSRLAKGQVGLTISGDLLILDGALSFGGKFTIWADVDWSDKSISYANTSFDEFRIKGNDLAGFKLSGSLVDNSSFWKAVENKVNGISGNADEAVGEISEDTQKAIDQAKDTYKTVAETIKKLKGFRGDLAFELPGKLFTFKAAGAYVETTKTSEEIAYEQNKRWSKIKDDGKTHKKEDGTIITGASDITVDETYTYAFLEIAVGSKALSSIQPIGINEISGGFYMNCKKKDLNKSFDSSNVKPQYGMVGGMLGIGLSCGGENAINANGDLTVFYDMFHNRLSTIRIKAELHALSASSSGKGLINASATITYEDADDKYFEVDVTVDAKADLDEALAEFVGSDYVKSLKEFSQSTLDEMGEDEGRNTETSKADKEKGEKKGESTGHLSAGLYINVNFKITWREKGQEYDKAKWHLYIGKPTPEEERCRLTLIDFALGKKSDMFAMWATIYADAYLCFGNELPTDDLPPIPDEISDYLGLKNEKLNQGDKDLEGAITNDRTKQFSTFKPGGNNGGVMFGAKVYGDMGLNAGIVYARTTAIAGFDVMLVKLKKGTKCIGGGEAGKNGWYGMGQVYALLKGEIGLNIDMWLFSGHIPLIDVGMGALLKAGMPNPTWFYGKAKAHFRLLGGLIKGSASVQLKAGEVCTPEFGNPLDDIEIFNEVTPGEDNQSGGWNADHAIDPDLYPSFTTNMTMNTPFRLLDENKAYAMADFDEDLEKYSENASRTYRFMLSPDSIRLARYNVDQYDADKPVPEFDERVTYSTKNHELFNVASGTLDINKLYTLKLSGYAQEWRNGEWGDPFFNDSTTGYKDKRVKWYQSEMYYFRTSPKAPTFEKDVRIFNTDYVNDIARPTMALARTRKASEKFDDISNPVTLRIEVSPNGKTGWESPSKIIHNESEKEKYEESVKKRDEAYQKAYEQALAEYEQALAEYNRLRDEAHTAWVDTVFNPYMDAHYPGWKDWEFSVKTKVYIKKQEFAIQPPKDWNVVVPPHIDEDSRIVNVEEALEIGQLQELKDVYNPNKDALDGLEVVHDFGQYLDRNTVEGNFVSTGKLDKLVSPTTSVEYLGVQNGLNTGLINEIQTNSLDKVDSKTNEISIQGVNNVGTSRVNQTSTRVTTTVRDPNTTTRTQTSDIRRNIGPMPEMEADAFLQPDDTVTSVRRVANTNNTTTVVRQVGNTGANVLEGAVMQTRTDTTATTRRGVTTTGTSDITRRGVTTTGTSDFSSSISLADSLKSFRPKGTEVAGSDSSTSGSELKPIEGVQVGSVLTGEIALKTIHNKFNPAYGDASVSHPIIITILVDSEGNEEVQTKVFTVKGDPFVEYKGDYVVEEDGITDEQWRFLNDHDVPIFFFENTSVQVPTKPAYGDANGAKIPDLYVPDYQRDMDSKTFSVDIDEYTYNNGDYIFLRTKNAISTSFVNQMKSRGYNYMRISINRIHKKAFDDMQEQLDEVIKEYKTRRAEIVDEKMGDEPQEGYDSKASMGKDFNENNYFAEDGSLNVDAYLNSYLGELENDIIDDSLAVQRIRSNMDLKDFSECLYEKIFPTPTYDSFQKYFDAVKGNVYGPMIRHQLLNVEWKDTPSQYTIDADVVKGQHWMKDPYFALGYWSKWAMIGGYPPVGFSDFPGLQLTLDMTDYRTNHSPTYTDGGHLLSHPNGYVLGQVRTYFMPNQYTAEGKDNDHRYGDSGKTEGNTNFMTINDAHYTIQNMLYADCRLAAAIRNAAYDLSEKARLGGYVKTDYVYSNIQKPYGKTLIEINDHFSKYIPGQYKQITVNNKASFLGLNVAIMIYADYTIENRIKSGFPFTGSTNNKLLKGAVEEGSVIGRKDPNGGWDVVISQRPEISWRLNTDIAHQVVMDNNLYINEFKRTTAKSLTERISTLKFQSYRLNAFHTKINSATKETAYDVLNNTYIKADITPQDFKFNVEDYDDFDYHLNLQ